MSSAVRKFRVVDDKVVEVTAAGVVSQPVGVAVGAYREDKPLESVALSCHPEQVEEFNDRAKREGLTGITYRPDGMCEVTSRKQRRDWMRVRGLHDQDGGYSD